METPRLNEFRIYYNTNIRPELVRMERERKRMLFGILGSVFGLVVIMLIFAVIDAGFMVLYLAIPVLFYLSSFYFRVKKFKETFKPAVVSLILEFINQAANYRELSYQADKMIGRDRFQHSELFIGRPVVYEGEDYIKGMVGEMAFELSEIYVQELSRASNRLELIFGGIFIHAIFPERATGHLVAWPRHEEKNLRRSIKEFIARGGIDAEIELLEDGFSESFVVYAKKNTVVHQLLTKPMQEALLEFMETTERELYFALHNQNIFVGIGHDRDLLEPHVFRSNLSYPLVREFYTDITLMLKVIEEFDKNH
ncbi:hypothetical protein CEQ90_14945 [Lewinellaceae bacterium SD302]|nr:hypothetical protein CEQ90_14945 [Lewinellaceae bacterium SD302]